MGVARTRRVAAPLVGGLALLVADVARADTLGSPRFVLDYTAPSGCPDRDAFLSAIRARTPRPQLVIDDHEAIAIRVVVETESAASASGRLDLREPDGTAETRTVSSRTCDEVANALALVAAVMLDPDALAGPVGPAPLGELPPPPSPAPPPTAPRVPEPVPVRVEPAPPPPPPPPPPRRPRWQGAAGAELGVLGGVGPAIAPMAGGFVEAEHDGTFVSSARLSVDAARTSSDLRGGSQTYEWVAGTVRICPVHVLFPGPPGVHLVPCAGLQIGGHRGTTSHVADPTSSLDVWLAPLVGATLAIPLSSSISLELQGSAFAPLRRTRFFLAPSTTIFEVPVLSATASLGTCVRF